MVPPSARCALVSSICAARWGFSLSQASRSTAASSRPSTIAIRTSRAGRWSGGATQLEESVARYLSQLDTADRQEPTRGAGGQDDASQGEAGQDWMRRWRSLRLTRSRCSLRPISRSRLTDPDSRSMATSGRGSGIVGYNVQVAVDTEHHLIVTHEVTNVGTDRSQLASVAKDGEGGSADRKARSRCGSRLLRRRGNPGVRGGRASR